MLKILILSTVVSLTYAFVGPIPALCLAVALSGAELMRKLKLDD